MALSTQTLSNRETVQTGFSAFPEYIYATTGSIKGSFSVGTGVLNSFGEGSDEALNVWIGQVDSSIRFHNEGNQPTMAYRRADNSNYEIGQIDAEELRILDRGTTGAQFYRGGLHIGAYSSTYAGSPKFHVEGSARIIDDLEVSATLHAETIGSESGAFGIAGTTVTFDEPPIDTIDRMAVLNNGEISWPQIATGVLTEGGSSGSTFTVTAAMVHTGSMTAPSGTTVDGAGKIGYDSTDGVYVGHNGTDDYVIAHATETFSVTISSPPGGWVGAVIPIWSAPPDMAVTLRSIRATIQDGTSVTYNLEERAFASLASSGTDVLGSDAAADTDGTTSTVFSNASIAAGAHLAFTCSAVSGSPNYIHIQVNYSRDVE